MCGKIFSDSYSLKIHKRSHKGEKCFKCGICNFATAAVKQLDRHRKKHTKWRPFKGDDDDCGKNFGQKLGLKMHNQRMHNLAPEQKKFVCEHYDQPALASEYEIKTVEKVECSGEPRYGKEGGTQQENKDIEDGVMTLECSGTTRVSKDISKVKKVKAGKQRGKHLAKHEVIEEKRAEVITGPGKEVEEDGYTLEGSKERIKSPSENDETTLVKMESAFEDPSTQEVEEFVLRLQDLAEMEEHVILLTDLPVKPLWTFEFLS